MYQVVINDKYYVSEVEGESSNCVRISHVGQEYVFFDYIENITLTANKCDAKLFLYKSEAKEVAEQIGGRIIEYIRKEI